MPTVLVVGILVFLMIHLTGTDPAAVILGSQASPESVAALNAQLGYDRPLWEQFISWIGGAVTGDLGVSAYSQEPVTSMIVDRIPTTLSLAVVAMVMTLLIAIPTGILAAWKRDSLLDPLFMSGSLLGISIPNFWAALMLVSLFAVNLGWFPVAGYVPLSEGLWPWLSHLVLPGFVLAIQQAGLLARMLRDGLLQVLHEDFVRTARAKGLGERSVLVGHALRNAMLPTLTEIGNAVAGLLGGVIIIEMVFAIPGIGNLLILSIEQRDLPVIQGAVMFVAICYVLVNLVTDLLYSYLDPRISA
ncbi:ABC transporter permease [Nocardioides sp. BSK12Z-3]|nr:ABC transporter permease [Nocardioides bruguierae]